MNDPITIRPPRRDPAREERLEILRMLEAGTISADEAAQLLDALERTDRPPTTFADPPGPPTGPRARQVRIRITDGDSGQPSLNLAVPFGLIDAGLGIARRFAPESLLSSEVIEKSVAGGFRGSLLDLNEDGERIEIIVE